MEYGEIVFGTFVSRPNRFIARVVVGGQELTVHVKNTGRCKELLVPGSTVVLEKAKNPERKTPYDLVGVYKKNTEGEDWLFNIDSQAPNKVVGEWLAGQGFDLVRPEFTFGKSRVDFYMERGDQKYLLEVKGCTLEIEGVGYFPDAPTERGIKHLDELAQAQRDGYRCGIAFVIAMEGVSRVLPNMATHPQFGEALERAKAAGVRVLHLQCAVTPDTLRVVDFAVE